MINPSSRRLRVRDDGTGKSRSTDGTLAEFEAEDAVVLLGDPGMGKTTLFREAGKENYTTVRKFLSNPPTSMGDVLYLDALDEYRAIESGEDASSAIAKALCVLGRPKFRLSCRAADWYGSRDEEVISVASTSGRTVVLELLPLSRDEIKDAVQGIVPNADLFLKEVESAGLGSLLGNPQTLELVARAWVTDVKPKNKFETYDQGISALLKEINHAHTPRGRNRPSLNDMRNAAGAAASVVLLSGSVGISRTEAADDEGYAKFTDIPYPITEATDSVVRRRLFVSSHTDRFEPVHRTIAEFLAAEDLSRRIVNGLPIERVMALICGVDGKPVSSLRGVFAWLMCKIGNRAEGYMERDPYGVAVYGDPSMLSPAAQRSLWIGLRRLADPWFLANEDDRASFRELANPNTATVIKDLLIDPGTGLHLKIAILESIANSEGSIGIETVLHGLALEPSDNIWLRSTAVRAFSRSVNNDWLALESLDRELAQAAGDYAAPYVRISLLSETITHHDVAPRILSILKQALCADVDHVSGSLYRLIDLPSDSDLDEILDGASSVLAENAEDRLGLQTVFDHWLSRRLALATSMTAAQLVRWLRAIHVHRHFPRNDYLDLLRSKFQSVPALFDEVFEILVRSAGNDDTAFRRIVLADLWQLLPVQAWPGCPSKFFLSRAEGESNASRGATMFLSFLSWLPTENVSTSLAEAGFDLLVHRPDIRKVLKNWDHCKIEKWRLEDQRRQKKTQIKTYVQRKRNITYLEPRTRSIREGIEHNVLIWAARVYCGLSLETSSISVPRDRLVHLTNEAIADALIEGLSRYAEGESIPHREEILIEWQQNRAVYSHCLLSLSVFLRLSLGLPISETALPHCMAAVLSTINTSIEVPGFDDVLSEWIVIQARHNSESLESVITQMWLAGSRVERRSLPGFYELNLDPGATRFLASVSATVLRDEVCQDTDSVTRLVGVLILYDQRAAISIGEEQLAKTDLAPELRTIWLTVLFLIDPIRFLAPWQANLSAPGTNLWLALKVISGNEREQRSAVILAPEQRSDIVRSFGKRFPMTPHPTGGWSGSENSWDASDFVIKQINRLSAETSPGIAAILSELESDGSLETYRDTIRHQRTHYEKIRRDSNFIFPPPENIRKAIENGPPAKPLDLLAYVVDHLCVLGRELSHTQKERYRAYWNEDGRELSKPKREETCSGFLADDLQKRVQVHNLLVTVEHHMVDEKECDLVVLQSAVRLLPLEVKHHYNRELWTAWRTQLDRLYTLDANAGGLGVYVVLWSGEAKGRKLPRLPTTLKDTRPKDATGLGIALEMIIPEQDRHSCNRYFGSV